jgi:uncharacterized protein YkwD
MKNSIAIFFLFMLFNALGQAQFNLTDYCYSNNKNIVKKVNIDSLENVLLEKINNLRIENGINPLIEDDSLSAYSKLWSENMLLKDKIYHSNITENGIASENVYLSKSFGVFPMEKAYILLVTDRIFNSWITSEKHRNNMLLEDVKSIGLSIVLIPNGMVDESSTMVVR